MNQEFTDEVVLLTDASKGIRARTDQDYLLGHSENEIERLQLQANILRPITERLLRAAGIREGMRVLDIGCGAGDVAMLAAETVGQAGFVVAVDESEAAISLTRRRVEKAGFKNIRFEVASLPYIQNEAAFDAATCRYVLVHQDRPAEFLRSISRLLKSGGVIACHEPSGLGMGAEPAIPRWSEMGDFLRRSLVYFPGHEAGEDMADMFSRAGLVGGKVYHELPIALKADSPIIDWFARTARTFQSLARSKGATEKDLPGLSGFEESVRKSMRECFSHVSAWVQVCGWANVREQA